MKQFKKTPITKERLLSLNFVIHNEFRKEYMLKLDENLFIIFSLRFNIIDICDDRGYDSIQLDREFKKMEEIKELITGLTGKRL